MAQIIHKVKAGETVLSICLTYRLSWKRFTLLNPDFDDNFGVRSPGEPLRIGERLVVGYTDPLRHVR